MQASNEQTPHEAPTCTGDSIKKSLPDLNYRHAHQLLDAFGSHFGRHNPFQHPVTSKDTVWFFDNTAYRSPQNPSQWNAEFVATYFLTDSGKDLGHVVAVLTDLLGRSDTPAEVIQDRVQPFVDTTLPSRVVELAFGGEEAVGSPMKLGPSERNGLSSNDLEIISQSNWKDGNVAKPTPLVSKGTTVINMETHFAEPDGWGFISDIDDSIKITLTPSPLGILSSTFTSIPQPVAGMPELYAHIAKLLSPAWFYLSASPYNLYPFLREFRQEHYPPGTIILRDASWTNLSGFLTNLTLGTQSYKVSRMDKIHQWLPKRRMICLGDSTQSDPEAYGEIYHKYPGWVKAIYIRKVTDVAEFNEADKNSDTRFEKAFLDVPKEIWKTFTHPSELVSLVDALQP
ncbi:MAG: hypothetical protein M1829_000477 [Trizodia sp. TS-e1964]|nr:MAG: hypothetical protein M1829_000477 [Trizodia sp. TS-e1964]